MPFHEFASLPNFPDDDALLEQSSMMGAIYWNRPDKAQEIIGICGGGSLLAFDFDQPSWPPSFVAYRQGNNVFVNVTGTHNENQVYGDILGIFGREFPAGGNRVHSFFDDAWDDLWLRLQPNFPVGWQGMHIHLCGHSLGAAAAFIGALRLKIANPGTTISYLGFAQPRAMTFGYVGALPDTSINMISDGDIIPRIPFSVFRPSVLDDVVAWATGVSIDWRHYGAQVLIFNSGDISDEMPVPGIAFDLPGVVFSTFAEHRIANYMARIKSRWTWRVNQGQNVALLPVIDFITGLPEAQNLNVNIDALASVNVAAQNTITFLEPVGGPLTVQNLPTVNNISGQILGLTAVDPIFSGGVGGRGAMDLKVTFFLSNEKGGTSETFYLPGKDFTQYSTAQVLAYWNERRKISGKNTGFEYARVSDVANPRNVQVYPWRDLNLTGTTGYGTGGGYAGADGNSDYASVALLARRVSGNKFGQFWLRGVPDGLYIAPSTTAPIATFINNFDLYKAMVIAGGYSWKGVTAAGAQTTDVLSAVTGADGTALFTLADNIFAAVPVGKHVVVRVSGQVSPKNINGQYTVEVKSPNTCKTLGALPVVNFVAGTGKMNFKATAFYPIQGLKMMRITTRRAGRPFGVLVGRS